MGLFLGMSFISFYEVGFLLVSLAVGIISTVTFTPRKISQITFLKKNDKIEVETIQSNIEVSVSISKESSNISKFLN